MELGIINRVICFVCLDGSFVNAIKLHDVPKKYFAKEFLMQFYGTFGTIINIELISFPTKTAVIKYVNRENAQRAMKEGAIFEEGEIPIKITWASSIPDQSKTSDNNIQTKKITKKVNPCQRFSESVKLLKESENNKLVEHKRLQI